MSALISPKCLAATWSLISPDNIWALWAVILVGTTAAIWLEQKTRWGAWLSGPVLALAMAMVLSNLRIMPMTAPTYDLISDYLVPIAVPLLLFRANLVAIFRETGTLLIAFHAASLGTIVGAVLSAITLGDRVPNIGEICGTMTASYIGGAVNFFAVKENFQLSENLGGPLLVADNFIMALCFLAMLYIVSAPWIRRHFRTYPGLEEQRGGENIAAAHWRRKEISLLDIATALSIAVTIVALAMFLKYLLEMILPTGMMWAMLSNRFVLITTLSVLAATLFGKQLDKINGPDEVGGFLLFMFLFTIGLPADLLAVILNVPMMFVLCLIMAVANIVVALVIGKILKLPLEDLVLAMNASLGGPTTAAAMAISKGWSRLVLPSLLAGLYGYVIGTPVGIFVGEFIRARWG